jgi:hypothetical protein
MTEVAVENKKWVRKTGYWAKLNQALDEYKNILIIGVDFVGSNQMQKNTHCFARKRNRIDGKEHDYPQSAS